MADLNQIEKTPESAIDPELLMLCRSVEAKRAKTVINHILVHGYITTEELNDLYGYDHPPRAVRDVRENGIPLITHNVVSPRTGRRMGAYTFDDIKKIKNGRIGGRTAFSKKFRQDLIDLYGSKDAISNTIMDERYLQIDHRIPYEIAGDSIESTNVVLADFMLLDASSNRAKSWSCEQCENFLIIHNPEICRSCFWAYPESYTHIALKENRRSDLVWSGEHEVNEFAALEREAKNRGINIADLIKEKLRGQ
jgi:hypothetical protein